MKLPAAFEAHRESFLEAMKVRAYSPRTMETYADAVLMLFKFLVGAGIADLREVKRQDVRQYQLWLKAQDYSGWTVLTRLQGMRRFFEHLEAADAILVNPCAGLVLPRLANHLPKTVLTVSEAKAVLDAPDTATPKGLRDRAILEVFYSTGIRLEEMAQLSLEDVDCANGFVRVRHGKCAKDRVVPLGAKASECVGRYLHQVREKWSPAEKEQRALWLSSKPPYGPLKAQAIEVTVKRYGRKAGIAKALTPHVWRHTCASHLVASGSNVACVQQLLGHRSLRTTQIYLRTSAAEVKAAHAQAHPRNNQNQAL